MILRCSLSLYGVQWERNCCLHGGISRDPSTQVAFATTFLQEFHAALMVEEVKSTQSGRLPTRWCIPPVGTIKLNTDATVVAGTSFVGIGMDY